MTIRQVAQDACEQTKEEKEGGSHSICLAPSFPGKASGTGVVHRAAERPVPSTRSIINCAAREVQVPEDRVRKDVERRLQSERESRVQDPRPSGGGRELAPRASLGP